MCIKRLLVAPCLEDAEETGTSGLRAQVKAKKSVFLAARVAIYCLKADSMVPLPDGSTST
jgi:hypothetical protein